MASQTRLKRTDDVVWIEGVPLLTGWHKLPTFVGALEAALSVTDHPVSYVDLLGLSGLAFRTRWFAGPEGPTGCPCSPTGETPMVWSAMGRGTGWQLEPFDGDGWDAPPMKRIVPRIVDAIDAWDEAVRRRERAIIEGALQIEERAIALLERASGTGSSPQPPG
jgi:hypothetical protein